MTTFFKTIDELKENVTLEADVKLHTLEPYIRLVEGSKMVYELGAPFFAALGARYNATNPNPALTDSEKTAISLLQNSIAHLALVQGMPSLLVSLSGSGLLQKTTGDKKGIYQWQKIDFENSHLEAGYASLEALLEHLWSKRAENQFLTWKDSEAEKRSVDLVINTAKDFNQYYPIGNSRRTFESLKSSIRTAESTVLKPLLGNGLYAELKQQISTFAVSEKNAKILGFVKGIVANTAIQRAIGLLTFRVTSEGLMVTTITGSGSDSFKQQTTPTPEMIRDTKAIAQQAVDNYVSDLLEYLYMHLSDYPLFIESDYYTSAQTTPSINSTHTKIVSL